MEEAEFHKRTNEYDYRTVYYKDYKRYGDHEYELIHVSGITYSNKDWGDVCVVDDDDPEIETILDYRSIVDVF